MSSSDVLAARRRTMGWQGTLFYDEPIHMVKGDGVWLYDDDTGRRYMDCYNNVPVLGIVILMWLTPCINKLGC